MLFTVYRKPGLTPGRGQNIYNCDYDRPPNENQVCDVNVKDWFPCTQENNFNYHKSAPCVFIKLNKVIDFTANRSSTLFIHMCSAITRLAYYLLETTTCYAEILFILFCIYLFLWRSVLEKLQKLKILGWSTNFVTFMEPGGTLSVYKNLP